MKVQGEEELGAGLQGAEERAEAERDGDRRDIWAVGVRDRGDAKNAWESRLMAQWMMELAPGQETGEGQAHS